MDQFEPIKDKKQLEEAIISELQRVAFSDPTKKQFDLFGGQQIKVSDKLKALELIGKACGMFSDKAKVSLDASETPKIIVEFIEKEHERN